MRNSLTALIPVLILVALCVVGECQTGLVVPGDLGVTQDLDVGDDLDVSDDSNTDGTATFANFSNAFLPQRYIVEFDESVVTGKAYPDTIVGMEKRLFFVAPTAGRLFDFVIGFEDAGSGYDSLLVDAFNGVGASTSMTTTLPRLMAADGDKTTTLTDGRAAVLDVAERELDKGERVELWAKLYGSAADPPTGLHVWGVFQPDYGN